MKHIIYTYKGKVYQSWKDWDFDHIEEVLKRLGASYGAFFINKFVSVPGKI